MFHFYTPPADFSRLHPAPRVAHICEDMEGTRALLAVIGKHLGFPWHYGKNFDAFWDCVRNLEVEEYLIVILHDTLPRIPASDLPVYLGLLRDAALHWTKRRAQHRLEAWFPDADRKDVESLLAAIPPADAENID